MSDTPRTTAALQTLFANNTSGDISAQDLRDAIVSYLNTVDHSVTSFALSLLDDADAAAVRTTLGLGTAAVVNTGTGSGNAILGNDSRLTDSRTPTAHASSHGTGQADAIVIAESQVTNLVSDLAGKLANPAGADLNMGTHNITNAGNVTAAASTGFFKVGTDVGIGGNGVSGQMKVYDFGNSRLGSLVADQLLGNTLGLGADKIVMDGATGNIVTVGSISLTSASIQPDGSASFANNALTIDSAGDISTSGSVTAASFHGDGSALSNLPNNSDWASYNASGAVNFAGNGLNNCNSIVPVNGTDCDIGTPSYPFNHVYTNIVDINSGHITLNTDGSAVLSSGQVTTDIDGNLTAYTLAINSTALTVNQTGDVSGNSATFTHGITLTNQSTVQSIDVVGTSGADIRLIIANGIGLYNGCGIFMDGGAINTSGACTFGNVGCGILQVGGGDPDTAPNSSIFIDINTGNLVWKTIDGLTVLGPGPA